MFQKDFTMEQDLLWKNFAIRSSKQNLSQENIQVGLCIFRELALDSYKGKLGFMM